MKVIMVMALTVDGKIGKSSNHFTDWTAKGDKKLFKTLSENSGAVIMGSKTFDTIGKPLSDRKNVVLTRNEDRGSEWDNLVFTGKSPKDILAELDKEGFSEVILAGGARVNYLFAKENLIDEIIVTYSPIIFGAGISLFSEAITMNLRLEEVKQLGVGLIFARYEVIK